MGMQGYRRSDARAWSCAGASSQATAFHRGLPGYAPTPLVELPALATELGVERVVLKDESARFGLGAFKMLGASWAIYHLMSRHVGGASGLAELREKLAGGPAPRLVTATDGNHGRAVARMAGLLGLEAHVFLPADVDERAAAAIEAEGAGLVVVEGSYDETVRRADDEAAGDRLAILVQDTAWPGYEEIPRWIVEGYATLFVELDEQLGGREPGLVAVPMGVGSLAQAAVTHYRGSGRPVSLLGVEPESAACVLESLLRQQLSSVETGSTVMDGLNCGTPSTLAWPYLREGMDAAVAIGEEECEQAMKDLAALGVDAGACGAAALAGVRAVPAREGTVVLLNTEGVKR